MKRKKPVYMYEVYCPMTYCEIYLVPATSRKEARRKMDKDGSTEYQCIGEIASRQHIERRGKRIS